MKMRADLRSRQRKIALLLSLLTLLLAGLALERQRSRSADSNSKAVAQSAESARASQNSVAEPPQIPPRAPMAKAEKADSPTDQRTLWESRLARAEFTLKQYLQSTRYPPNSRPLREHPDRIYPRAPIGRTLPLLSHGQASDVNIKLTQDRRTIIGGDSVRLQVRCEDSLSAKIPCTVEGARALVTPGTAAPNASRFPSSPVTFTDSGDALSTVFQPAQQGFAGYSGPLRVAFTVTAGGEAGELFFDLAYTGDPPARFTGKIREAVEAGSLQFYVGIEVRKAGRYVITGRTDDSRDRPLAYLEFNDLLKEGTQEVKLTVFGKLVRDESPAWPLKLRDVDGFLLFEDRDPDREEFAMLEGVAYKSQTHTPGEFSADEWQSETRDRHIKEFSKDVDIAKSALGNLPPETPAR